MSKGKLHQEITGDTKSNFSKYRQLYLGNMGLLKAILFELVMMMFSNTPGALGLAFRKIFYPLVFGKVGKNVIFGKGITIRHPGKIEIGNNVVVEDNCVLDAKGEDNKGIKIGTGVILSRNVIISCKNADIEIGDNTVLGINSAIHAVEGSNVHVGNDVLIAGYVYIIGGGNYNYGKPGIPIREQGLVSKGGIRIGNNVWIGASANITDGVTIEEGNIIGACSLVNKPIDKKDFISFGVPAKLYKKRIN
ncbi:MAG: DapH/DapD/GlmU-related protein [Candidatus Humimicrobiaceae bacterium]